MRTGAAADTVGFFHETAFYDTDDEFLAVVLPFLQDGIGAGEPTLVACTQPKSMLLHDALGVTTGVTFHIGDRYANPAATIRAYRDTFAELVADGAEQIRIVGEVPHPGTGAAWNRWARYEAAVNAAFAEFPVWGLCPYDVRSAPADVIDDAHRAHPHIAGTHGDHYSNALYIDPAEFVRGRPAPPDPIESTAPEAELTNPSGRETDELVAVLTAHQLASARRSDVRRVIVELVANAAKHGQPPTRLRAWRDHARTVFTINDRGHGPVDPFVGLVPPDSLGHGYPLWLAHLTCDELDLRTDENGFTIRIVMTHDT